MHRTVPMDFVDGDTSDVVRGFRYDMAVICRRHNIPRKYITPYTSRWGHGFVIQGADYGHDHQHVILWTRQGHWVRFPLKAGTAQYHALMALDDYAKLMAEIERDFPPGSVTGEIASTLGQLLQIWAAAKDAGENTLDLRVVDRTVAARLNPFVRAWLHRGDENAADVGPLFRMP
ncbi:UNVERIFIED_ORG: hypothetical protein FHR35_009172 [Microbispora rosea subsp. rosea]